MPCLVGLTNMRREIRMSKDDKMLSGHVQLIRCFESSRQMLFKRYEKVVGLSMIYAQMRTIAILVVVLETAVWGHPVIPASDQKEPIALINGIIHPANGETIKGGSILFSDGKILAVGKNISLPPDAIQIDVNGDHIYPGLFNTGGQLGLVEVNSVRATKDYSEAGSLNPNVRAAAAVNPDSEAIPVTRSNGVLITLTIPTGGLISGKSAVLQLDGWTWEDLSLKTEAGVHVNWPSNNDGLKRLESFFDTAIEYRKRRDQSSDQREDLRLAGLLPVLNGQIPLIAHADSLATIRSAVSFANTYGIKLVIHGGYDAERCANLLRENNVPVIVGSVYRLPRRRSDFFDDAYTLPARLDAAGVKFCISGVSRFGASNLRNRPYHAATAIAYGLDKDEALRSITIHPAEILGVSDRIGTLEPKKDATLIVTNGDLFETATNVRFAFVAGRRLDLNDRHRILWEKYRTKYERQGLLQKSSE